MQSCSIVCFFLYVEPLVLLHEPFTRLLHELSNVILEAIRVLMSAFDIELRKEELDAKAACRIVDRDSCDIIERMLESSAQCVIVHPRTSNHGPGRI